MTFEGVRIVSADSMKSFCVAAATRVGLSIADAKMLADNLVEADLRGTLSHGVIFLPRYIRGLHVAGVNPKPQVRTLEDFGATALLDGDDGLGRIVAHAGMTGAMKKATEFGIGTVVMRNSNHYGTSSYWSMMALDKGMIGFTTTNSPPGLAPWGGKTRSYSNSPVSWAIPAGIQWPIVLDMSMSVVAHGRIRLAALTGQPIPLGWAMNSQGEPTSDSREALEGLMMPLGGYKGYGLAMVNEVLCGVLSGGPFGKDIKRTRSDYTEVMKYSHMFMALDISRFMPLAEFKQRVDRMVLMMKESETAEGFDRILLPGERSFETRRRRVVEGIPYPAEIITLLDELAQEFDIPTIYRQDDRTE